jgi:hypothetical protein
MIAVFFYLGPSVVYYMPRVMPGCLLIHIGIDLSTEALVDSYPALDIVEYSSVVAITLVMTFYGMTAGLGLGVLCAALTFTIQVRSTVERAVFRRCPDLNLRCATAMRARHAAGPLVMTVLLRECGVFCLTAAFKHAGTETVRGYNLRVLQL